MASLAQMDYCKSKNYDPEDPRCAKIFLTGRFIKVDGFFKVAAFFILFVVVEHHFSRAYVRPKCVVLKASGNGILA